MTHYIGYFTEPGDHVKAFCGRTVLKSSHSAEPECEFCQAILKSDAQSTKDLEALRQEVWDPRGIIRHPETGDPVSAYLEADRIGLAHSTCPRCHQFLALCLCDVDKHWSER